MPIKSVKGRLPSKRLGLELQVEDDRLRFYENNVPLPESAEFIDHLRKLAEKLRRRAKGKALGLKKETRLREAAQQRLAEETRRREESERQLKQLKAELARLKARTD